MSAATEAGDKGSFGKIWVQRQRQIGHHGLSNIARFGRYVVFSLIVLDLILVLASITLELEYLDTQVSDCSAAFRNNCTLPTQHRRLEWWNDGAHGDDLHWGDHSIHDNEVKLAYVSLAIMGAFLIQDLFGTLARKKDKDQIFFD